MYNFSVHPSTVKLDGAGTKFLQPARVTKPAALLRALRESLPGKPGVRDVARLLGYDMPNAYGYYESAKFKKDALPLDKARLFAAAFEKLKGDPKRVLALAGLSPEELEREARSMQTQQPAVQIVSLQVALPNEAALTRMFEGMLRSAGHTKLPTGLAETLAQQLPGALSQSQALSVAEDSAGYSADDADPLPLAKGDHALPRSPRT